MSSNRTTSSRTSLLFDAVMYSIYLVFAWVLFRIFGVDEMLEHKQDPHTLANREMGTIVPKNRLAQDLPR